MIWTDIQLAHFFEVLEDVVVVVAWFLFNNQ